MSEFQSVIGYRESEASPFVVVRQTNTLLGLFNQGAIRRPKLAKDYFCAYTFNYLKAAEEGSDGLYDADGCFIKDIDLEVREAAHHAFVVFTWMHDRAKSPFLPKGFSRRGMLAAPITHHQFLERIKELKVGIWNVVEGEVAPHATLEAYPPLLRVFNFFKVGSKLPIRFTISEKKQLEMEREKMNDLLGGIDTSLE